MSTATILDQFVLCKGVHTIPYLVLYPSPFPCPYLALPQSNDIQEDDKLKAAELLCDAQLFE
jgi:hypothetical protein